jgi:Protein of unknown function (DUF2800)
MAEDISKPQHHRYGASGAEGWLACAGKIAMEQGQKDSANSYADEGSAAHFLAAISLETASPLTYVGKEIICWQKEGERDGQRWSTDPLPDGAVVRSVWPVTQEMAEYVYEYVKLVWDLAKGGKLLVEQRVEFGDSIGVKGAFGTSDTVILSKDGKTLTIVDLKYGYNLVDAELNPQLLLYALGAIAELELLYDLSKLKHLKLVIAQPRQSSFPEWSCDLTEKNQNGETILDWFSKKAATAILKSEEALLMMEKISKLPADEITRAQRGWFKMYLSPAEKACKWCKAKTFCCALEEENLSMVLSPEATTDDLVDLDAPTLVDVVEDLPAEVEKAIANIPTLSFATLAKLYGAIPQFEDWVKTLESRMLSELLAGEKHPDWKLVKGRPGNRAWADPVAAEEAFTTMRIKKGEMYENKLISPTAAEKLFSKKRPRVWKTLEEHISRGEGKTVIAPSSDKRQSINPYDDDLALLPDLKKDLRLTKAELIAQVVAEDLDLI